MSGYGYRLYGVRLRADRLLPGLGPHSHQGDADVELHLAGTSTPPVPDAAWTAEPPPSPVARARTPEGSWLRLRYAGRGGRADLVLDPAGRRVWASWGGGATLTDVTAVLLGPVLGCILRARGRACLHGSALRVGAHAVALLGPKGAGKSTTALALLQRGATLLADDVVALTGDAGAFRVHAGPAQLRLLPGPAAALHGSFDTLRPLWSREVGGDVKRYLDLPAPDEAAAVDAVPLAAVYVLGARDAAAPAVVPVPPPAALALLMAHRSVSLALDRAGHAADFALLGRLTTRVPVREVRRPEGLEHVGPIADLLLADAAADAAAPV